MSNTLTILSIFIIASCTSEKAPENKPNIILIMADDMGWGDWEKNGHPFIKTPHLNKMAEEGIQFTRFYSASPVCSPTRASCLTGRHPERIGISTANSGHIPMDEPNLAKHLKGLGYKTGHFGKWHLGTLSRDTIDANRGGRPQNRKHYSPPWLNGFDISFSTESKVPTFDPMVTPPNDAMDTGNRTPGKQFNTYYWDGPGSIVTQNLKGDDSRVIMDRVVDFISANKSEPFFSVIWFHAPHLPVLTDEVHRKMYDTLSIDQQHYYGVVTAIDEQVGRLIKHLEKENILNNTVVWFTSDNGPEGPTVGNRTQGTTAGLKGRKRSLNEGGIRVPGIAYWPGHFTPKIIDEPAFTSDYLPTIMDLVNEKNYDRQDHLDGESILNVIVNDEPRKKPIHFYYKGQESSMNSRYKIYKSKSDSTFQLFDIINDPMETNDISESQINIKDSMIEDYRVWLKEVMEESEKINI